MKVVLSEQEILAGVAEVARQHLDYTGAIEPGMRLIEDLRLDSLRLLTLAVEVENRFRVRLDPEEEAAIETVGDLVRTVAGKLALKSERSEEDLDP
ncbi:MAG: phosphopantetheine-binding protein [Acidobacteriota bacterium]